MWPFSREKKFQDVDRGYAEMREARHRGTLYQLRTDEGILIGKFSADIAGKLIRDIRGEWREKRFNGPQGTYTKLCYVITADQKFGFDRSGQIMEFFLWVGFYIQVED